MGRMSSSMRAGAVWLVVGLVLGAGAYGGIAAAMHDPNTIHACADDQAGNLRLVEDSDDCRKNESALEWNVEGPQGPPGPPGPPGPQGEPGGLSGHEVVVKSSITVPPGEEESAIVSCPEGKVVTGGGPVFSRWSVLKVKLFESGPTSPGSWQVRVANESTTSDARFDLRAVCVDEDT